MSNLLSRYLNQPAKRCARCGGEAFRLTPAGALTCLACSPGESVAVLVVRDARWQQHFDGPLLALSGTNNGNTAAGGTMEPLAAESRGVLGGGASILGAGILGGGVGLAGGTAGACGLVDPDSPLALMCVSPRLDWVVRPPGSIWAAGDIEVAGKIPGWPPEGVYRPLDQLYFGWMVGQVESFRRAGKLGGEDLDAARRVLCDIAVEAVSLGVLGEWASNIERWPVRSPAGYRPPVVCGERPLFELVEWERKWAGAIAREAEKEKLKNERLVKNVDQLGVGGPGDSRGGNPSGGKPAGSGKQRAGGSKPAGNKSGSGNDGGRTLAGLG